MWTLVLANWKLVGIGVLAAVLGLTSLRLSHAKHDLSTARAALIDPGTKKPWQDEYVRDHGLLGTCTANLDDSKRTLTTARASIAAYQAAAAQRSAQAQKAADAVRPAQRSASKAVATVNAAKPGPDICKSAVSILMGEHG